MVDPSEANSLLALMRQEFTRYRSLVHSESPLEPAAQRVAEDCAARLRGLAGRLRQILAKQVAAQSPPVVDLSPELWRFYEQDILPNFKRIEDEYWSSVLGDLDLGELTGASPADAHAPESRRDGPILRAIWIGLQTISPCAENPEWELDDENVEEAARLTDYDFFDPDAWLANLAELRPIVTGRPARNFNEHIRRRLQEIYRSFFFGNWMAVFALARSLLEYCLRDRARSVGIDPSESTGGEKRLEALQDEFAERFPKLEEAMDLVRHSGNIVMHPSKERDFHYDARAVRRDALAVVDATRLLLSELYSPR